MLADNRLSIAQEHRGVAHIATYCNYDIFWPQLAASIFLELFKRN